MVAWPQNLTFELCSGKGVFVSLNLKGGSNMMHVLSASFFGYSHISIVMQVSFFHTTIHFTLWHKSLKGRFFAKGYSFRTVHHKNGNNKDFKHTTNLVSKKKLDIQQIKGTFGMGTHKRVNNKMDIFLQRTNFCKKGTLKCILPYLEKMSNSFARIISPLCAKNR